MSTWGQLRMLLSMEGIGLDNDLLDSYLNTRYEQILEKCKWTGVTYHYTLQTQAAYQSGLNNAPGDNTSDTVTATIGNRSITGTATSWSSNLVGTRFYIPGDSVYYTISSVPGPTQLMLERPYEGNGSDTTGTVYTNYPYVFMQNIYALPADVRTVVSALDPATGLPLAQLTKDALDQSAGTRTLVNNPQVFAVYDDTNEATPPVLHQIELFPPPLYARGIPIEYTHAASVFDGSTTGASPFPWVSDTVLLEGCRADIHMRLATLEKDLAQVHLASAKLHEAKYQEELAALLRLEFIQRRGISTFKPADRLIRHRLVRAGRGYNNTWRGSNPGGPV